MNIYALSSGRGPSGIAIVRVSGKDTLKVCKNLTKLKEINSNEVNYCLLYTSPSPRDAHESRMPSSA